MSADNRCLPGAEFHFTIPVVVQASVRTQAQISLLSADNHCLPGPYFHFTIPVAHRASGYSGADQPVVSRQSMFARVKIPFHDTCSSSGQRATLVQISPLSADNRSQSAARVPFHDTCSTSGQWVFWCRSARCQPTIELAGVRFPFHDTCSSSGQRVLMHRSACCQPTLAACNEPNSISRYL